MIRTVLLAVSIFWALVFQHPTTVVVNESMKVQEIHSLGFHEPFLIYELVDQVLDAEIAQRERDGPVIWTAEAEWAAYEAWLNQPPVYEFLEPSDHVFPETDVEEVQKELHMAADDS